MDANYEKLYAYLAGQVDDSLQRIGAMLTAGSCGRAELVEIGEILHAALLTAEEMFISETSVPDTETNFP